MPETSEATKRFLTHRRKAEQLDVSTKTIDRWCQTGILRPPVVINNRKYHDIDEKPRSPVATEAA